ncbi:MAG: hypothetical protein ABJZ55_09390 [Fuerstiella sp.]
MKYLPVFNWMMKWSLLAILLAGSAGIYVWKNTDSLVHSQLITKFRELAPDLVLEVGRTEVRGTESVILHDVQLFEAATRKALLRAKQIRLDIDSDQLLNHQRLVLDQLVLRAPDILMEREQDGRWNWQNYEFHPPKVRGVLPAILIQDARIQLTLDHGAGFPAARLLLACPSAQAIPESADSYDFEGALDLPGAGMLRVSGAADFAAKTWHIGGALKDVSADQRLMDLANSADPSLQDKLSGIDTILASRLPPVSQQSDSFRTAGVPGAALQFGNDRRIAPQFLGTLDIDFEAASKAGSAIPNFKLLIDIRDGRIASGVLPVGLDQVTARFYKDNDSLEFRLTQAKIATGRISGNLLLPSGNQSEATAEFLIERLPINGQLRPMLPEKSRRIFDAYEPEGSVSMKGQVVRTADGKWRPQGVMIQLHDTEISYEKFQYPAVISGTLAQRPDSVDLASGDQSLAPISLDVNLDGQLGRHPFDVTGWWKNPGERGEIRLQLDVADFPLDGDFRNALLEPQQRVVDTLDLTGSATGSFIFIRPPGLNQPTHPFAQLAIHDGSVKLEKFPYAINELSGKLTYHGQKKQWDFVDLKGKHDNATIRAEGSYRGMPAPGVLQMTLQAKKAALDADLYNALTAQQRNIWSMLNPDGFCDLTADIHWTALPGQPAIVKFPTDRPVRIYNTKIKAAPFPYALTIEEALVSFDPNNASKAGVQRCEIHSFRAMHDDSPVQATGWFEAKPNQEWQLHLSDLYASKLKPDRELRAALPASWQESLTRMYNQGTMSILNSELDFRGDIDGAKNPTASWDMTINLDDCTVNAGLDVSEIHGRLTAQGVWDGFHLQNSGRIRLDTAAVLEMPFTNIEGPYSVNDVELVLGARRLFESNQSRASVPKEQRINANAYGGSMLVDAVVDLRDEGQYKFFSEVEGARLESYAALHIPDQPNLRGVVTAWMSLSGFGDDPSDVSGKGQLRISPAALYELPVMVKVLSAWSRLNPNVQNRTAFTYAFVNFDVVDQFFEMNKIDLAGEEISFRGQGSVGFKGAVDLDFYSQPPPRRGLSLPIINELFTRWTKIEVRGTTSRPQPNAKVLGQLDENLRQFLQPLNQRSLGAVPALQVPSLLPFQPLGPLNRQNIDRSRLPQSRPQASPLARPRNQIRL